MAMPLARQVVEDLAVEHGACIRPTLASVCPSCAERARTLRAAQCREGWHLEDEPAIDPDPATDDQKGWIEKRAEAQQLRDQADAAGQDTTDLDELIRELTRRSPTRAYAARPPRIARPGGTAPPAAARTHPTCPAARSTPARSARPTPPRTARSSAPPCSSR